MVRNDGKGLPQGEFDSLVESVTEELAKIVTRAEAQVRAVLLRHAPMLGRCSEFQLEVLEREIGSVGVGVSWRDFLRKAAMFGRGGMSEKVVLHDGVTFERFVALTSSDQKLLNGGQIPVRIRNVDQIVKIEALSKDRLRRIVTSMGVLEPAKQGVRVPRMPRYFRILYQVRTGDGEILLVCRCNSSRDIKVLTTVEQLEGVVREHKASKKVG